MTHTILMTAYALSGLWVLTGIWTFDAIVERLTRPKTEPARPVTETVVSSDFD